MIQQPSVLIEVAGQSQLGQFAQDNFPILAHKIRSICVSQQEPKAPHQVLELGCDGLLDLLLMVVATGC